MILEAGILPRNATKQGSNWDGKIQSKPNLVYFTTAYPVYYALAAAGSDDDLVIIRVDVDETELYPDEDFIAQCLWKQRICGSSLEDFIFEIDPTAYKNMSMHSLEHNGTACALSVSADQIIDYKIISRKNKDLILHIGGDAMPIPMNYKFKGEYYKNCIKALFQNGEAGAWQVVNSDNHIWEELRQKVKNDLPDK